MSSGNTTNIPKLHRPVFDGLDTFEDFMKVAMQEYEALKDTDEQGLDFANKTAMWIAYERFVESSRHDALFHDPLAQYFVEPYGKRLSDCMSIGLTYQVFDPPPPSSSPVPKLLDVGTNLGFGLEGHVLYTAARTKLINTQIDQWMKMQQQQQQQTQVVNLGSGLDTRPYWLSSLQNANCRYWEIDTESVQTYKRAVLEKLHKKDIQSLCTSVSLSSDLSKESIETVLLSNDDDDKSSTIYQTTVPTCWIAEGLIMYLSRETVIQLMENISKLSDSKSLLILNFATNTPQGPSIDEIEEMLESKHYWKQTRRLYFGQEGFHFHRYPPNKPANKILGVATFVKQ